MKPLVSILIPCYNSQAWLAQTLTSALTQTWTNKEIIVVDDGSKDSSLKVAKEFEARGVKIISQTNRGASTARNRALQESQGDFIQYLDSDDLLAPDKIECQMQLLLESNSDFIASGEWGRFYNLPAEANFIPEPVWQDMLPVDWLVCSWEGGGMMHPAAWLVPRPIAQKSGYWNEDLSINDDGEYFCRVILASKGVKFCSKAKSYYRSGVAGSLSRSQTPTAKKSEYKSIELCIEHILAVENSPRTRHACATILQRFIYYIYPDVGDLVKNAEDKVNAFGGTNLKVEGGALFNILTNIFGWKSAKQFQKLYQDWKS